jgi:hypothetical protein
MTNVQGRLTKLLVVSLLLMAIFSLLGWVTNPTLSASAAEIDATLARTPYPIGTPDPYPMPPDVVIKTIEVIQVTQDPENPVPLIAHKPTTAQVFVDCGADLVCRGIRNGMVRLWGVNEANETLGDPLAPIQSQSFFVGKVFSFQLPASWSSGQKKFTVVIGELQTSITVHFAEAKPLRVLMVPIQYQAGGRDATPDLARVLNGSWWAARVLPTADLAITAAQAPLVWMDGCLGSDCSDPMTRQTQSAQLLLQLEWLRTLYNTENQAQPGQQADFVYGWLPDDVYGGSEAPINQMAAFGDDDPQTGAQIFAHALGHLLGRPYTKAGLPGSCGNPAPQAPSDWPATYPDATIQTWGLDATTLVWKEPTATYDYLSLCWLPPAGQGSAWTSPHTYRQIFLQKLRVVQSVLAAQLAPTAPSMLLASGLIFNNGRAQLNPLLPSALAGQAEYPPIGTAYCVEAQASGGAVLAQRCFDLTFTDAERGTPSAAERFQVNLALPSGVERIVLKHGATLLAMRTVSAHAPMVTLHSPNGGEHWPAAGLQQITWQGSDADGGVLTYSVLYRLPGQPWSPLAANLADTQLLVDSATLAGGSEAEIRVLVSDGVNLASDESDAPFIVERKAPQSMLLSPAANLSMTPSDPLILHAQAYDLEDGTLAASAFHWQSNLSGDLGTGNPVRVALPTGHHILTVTATDSDGAVATRQVNVFVEHKLYLPHIQR